MQAEAFFRRESTSVFCQGCRGHVSVVPRARFHASGSVLPKREHSCVLSGVPRNKSEIKIPKTKSAVCRKRRGAFFCVRDCDFEKSVRRAASSAVILPVLCRPIVVGRSATEKNCKISKCGDGNTVTCCAWASGSIHAAGLVGSTSASVVRFSVIFPI